MSYCRYGGKCRYRRFPPRHYNCPWHELDNTDATREEDEDANTDTTSEDEDAGNRSWEKVVCSDIVICDKKFDAIQDRLMAIFGVDVRPWQTNAIHDLTTAGKDVIAVASTGSGGNLVSQSLPAVV